MHPHTGSRERCGQGEKNRYFRSLPAVVKAGVVGRSVPANMFLLAAVPPPKRIIPSPRLRDPQSASP